MLFEIDGKQELFFVIESKGTLGLEFLRPSERGKIECGMAHFKELAAQTGSNISLEYVTNMDDFVSKALAK